MSTWFFARASGLTAYALFALSTGAGLLLSGKLFGKRASRPLTLAHESLSIAGLLMVAAHMVAILEDTFFHFGVAGILVPGMSPYAPVAVGIGVVGAWLAAVVVASFYVRKKIGPRTWRRLHYSTVGLFVAMTLHGFLAGTDSHNPMTLTMYSLATGTFVVLLAYRIGHSVRTAKARATARAAHASRRASMGTRGRLALEGDEG